MLAIIALGSNLGDSRAIILDAMARLQKFSDEPVLKSSLWQTMPVDCPPDSPKFLNAIIGLAPRKNETPESLLKKLQGLEKEFGRAPKKVQNEPRSLDLDLIAFGNEVRLAAPKEGEGGNTPELVLPHPRAHLRRFVLQPLSEIAPDLILPNQTKTVWQLLAELKTDEVLTNVV
ncbi:MAG TPA: 2-amino-4-hydroxy-6-hydroxymethyldihydropteridine diphosphokinase [Candidatus Sulfotelmatobacter sp.]|nr:2-amino-4-hydroxy-6-hydroxymethyldihydropteridine diphosphokinase [Candidatus Sulfotelmatobacter sp.]